MAVETPCQTPDARFHGIPLAPEDPEVRALRLIFEALDPLEPVEQDRVLRWARDRYGSGADDRS